MAELEIHHEGHESDPVGQKVGVMAAIIAVFLAVVTIQSHRSHTAAVIYKTEANDKWAYYQAKSIKRTGYDIATETASHNEASAAAGLVEKFKRESERYKHESEEIQKEAQEKESETGLAERQALRYDLGEGLLELGLVLSSLYFISKKKLFPSIGIISAVCGVVIGATALFLH
jgi:hypothetical protein